MVMAALLILLMIGLLATSGLSGVSQDSAGLSKKNPKLSGLLVRVEINDASIRQRKAMVIAFPEHSAPPQQAGAARVRKYRSLSLLLFVGIATLLASPAANRNLSAMASAIRNWNSETQKTMFVELSEMRVRGS
jgi:hypothetical protein